MIINGVNSILKSDKLEKQRIFNHIRSTNTHVAADIANFVTHRKNIGLKKLQGEIERTGIETTNELIDELNHHPQYFRPDMDFFLTLMKDSDGKPKENSANDGKVFKEARFSQMESKYAGYIRNTKELTSIEGDIIENKNIDNLSDGPIEI